MTTKSGTILRRTIWKEPFPVVRSTSSRMPEKKSSSSPTPSLRER